MNLNNIKTAVLFDSLVNMGGSERATLVMAKTFNADIWTTNYNPDRTYPAYNTYKIHENPLSSLNIIHYPNKLQFIIRGLIHTESINKFRNLNLSEYDLIITIGQYTKHLPVFTDNKRIHYELFVKSEYYLGHLFSPWMFHIKKIDRKAVDKINTLLCNSENIKNKIKKQYNRDADVLYPAININMFKTGKVGNYFLSVQRISPEKNIEIQMEAFRENPDAKLIIVGSPDRKNIRYFEELKRKAPQNIIFTGKITDQELVELYSHARAAIQTHPDEDFGRIPVEAMASGKPCIAVNSGGFKESIVHGKTGLLIEKPYPEKLAEAVRYFNPRDFNPQDCLERSKLFSEETHIAKIKDIVAKL